MIERIEIDSDERGFLLVLTGDFVDVCEAYLRQPSASTVTLRLPQDAALELRRSVHETIDEWWSEGQAVLREFEQRARQDEAESGYALDDPKHPTYRERMADAADLARKRGREGGAA